CVYCTGQLEIIDELAATNPDAVLVLDHLGLPQAIEPPPPPSPWEQLPQVLALARHPNVFVKVTGACTMSHEPFPFADLWEPLGRLFDTFGIERCMWGTDWTRAVHMVTYREAVEAVRVHAPLSDGDRATL